MDMDLQTRLRAKWKNHVAEFNRIVAERERLGRWSLNLPTFPEELRGMT